MTTLKVMTGDKTKWQVVNVKNDVVGTAEKLADIHRKPVLIIYDDGCERVVDPRPLDCSAQREINPLC